MPQQLDVSEMLLSKFQPIAKRNFYLAIEGVDAFLIKTAARPQWTTEEVAINWMNSTRYVAGKTTFGEMAVTLHEAVAPSSAQQIMEWIRLCFENVSGRSGYADFYKRDIQLKITDPVGTVVQLWDIKGAWVKDANFGDVTYEGSDLAEITLSIRFDSACLVY